MEKWWSTKVKSTKNFKKSIFMVKYPVYCKNSVFEKNKRWVYSNLKISTTTEPISIKNSAFETSNDKEYICIFCRIEKLDYHGEIWIWKFEELSIWWLWHQFFIWKSIFESKILTQKTLKNHEISESIVKSQIWDIFNLRVKFSNLNISKTIRPISIKNSALKT